VDARRLNTGTLNAAFSCDPTWQDLTVQKGRVHSQRAGFDLTAGPPFAFAGYEVWCQMAARGWTFEPTSTALIARRSGLELHFTTAEEIDMAREIFLEGCYDVTLPGRFHVIDIGGNVGFAALRFASQANVERVFSFEPFGPTAEAFREQILRNAHLAARISLQQVGLGSRDQTVEVNYTAALRGSMSMHGLGSWRGPATADSQRVPITISRASTQLRPIITAARASGAKVMAKIDCEGAEYSILDELAASNLLVEFDAVCIEWHARGPGDLLAHLHQSGFATKTQSFGANPADLGLIHGFRIEGSAVPPSP
jgi:FkbM family methyltransferase